MTDVPTRQRRSDRRRAVLFFGVAGLLGSCLGAGALLDVIGPLAAAAAVLLATGTAVVAAALLGSPLARARAERRRGRAVVVGAMVPVLAYVLFALAYGLTDAQSAESYLESLRLTMQAGVVISVALVPIGALTGWLYVRAPQTEPLAP